MVPAAVLAAFGMPDTPVVPLPGGAGTAWRGRDVVFKPAGSARSACWTADLFSTLSGPGFRVPRPVSSAAGDWVAEGWVAWRWVAGNPADWSGVSPRWRQLAAASRAFHAALARVPAPPFLGRDHSPWTVADQVAWQERDAADVLSSAGHPLGQQLRGLLGALRPVDLATQLMHGDLGGNVLFAAGQPPAVIDFAPYWRPAGLAIAVAAVDALLWCDADPAILGELADEPALDQLLARGLVYRLVTEVIARGHRGEDTAVLNRVGRASQPVTDLVLSRLAGQRLPAAYLDDRRLAELAGRAVGTAVVELRAAGTATGHSSGPTAVSGGAVGYSRALRRLAQLADGHTVFVKAAGPGEDLAAELTAYGAVGAAPFMPRVLTLSHDPVPLIVLEALPPDGWVTRWTPQAIADTAALLALVHDTKAPSALPRWADPGAGGAQAWQIVAREPARLLRMHVCTAPWLTENLAALAAVASHAPRAGDRLVHGDVHGPNLCYRRPDQLVLVDWGTAAAGNPWFDTHDWLVALAANGGPPPEERQGPDAASHAALIVANEAVYAPSRDSKPALFEVRRRRCAAALAWAARLLGLSPPEPG